MKITQKLALGCAALAVLGTSGLVIAPSASAQIPPIVGPQHGEKHPELRRALRVLERAETDLRRSARDFGGHRQKAADLCHQAQQEIQLALQDDRN